MKIDKSESATADLLRTARDNDIGGMRRAIARRADVDHWMAVEPGRPTLFSMVLPKLKREAARVFVEARADLNARDDLGYTPLMRLMQFPTLPDELPGIVEDLIRKKVDLNAKSIEGKTALDLAAENAVLDVDYVREDSSVGTRSYPTIMLGIAERLLEAGAVAGKNVTREHLRRGRALRGERHSEGRS